jgi:hypothetical protein
MTTRKYLGTVDVDSGSIWIGDPCYVMGDDASHRVRDWGDDYCDKYFADLLDQKKVNNEPLGQGVGVAVPNFGGDGSYPVFVTYGRDGLVTKAEIYFGYSVDAEQPPAEDPGPIPPGWTHEEFLAHCREKYGPDFGTDKYIFTKDEDE